MGTHPRALLALATLVWPAVLVGAATLWAAADPEGSGGVVTLLGLGGWLLAAPEPTTPWALVAVVTLTAGIAWLTQLAHGSPDAPAALVALVLVLVGVLPWVSDARARRPS